MRVAPDLRAVRLGAALARTGAATRNEAIRLAHADGATIRAIAEAAGLSPARVHQIVHGR